MFIIYQQEHRVVKRFFAEYFYFITQSDVHFVEIHQKLFRGIFYGGTDPFITLFEFAEKGLDGGREDTFFIRNRVAVRVFFRES